MKSIGEGTEIIIGMEEGRFVPETIKSIEDFIAKIDNNYSEMLEEEIREEGYYLQ